MAFGTRCLLSLSVVRCRLSLLLLLLSLQFDPKIQRKDSKTAANIYRNTMIFSIMFSCCCCCCCCCSTNVVCMSAGISVVLSGWRLSKSLAFFFVLFLVLFLVKNMQKNFYKRFTYLLLLLLLVLLYLLLFMQSWKNKKKNVHFLWHHFVTFSVPITRTT